MINRRNDLGAAAAHFFHTALTGFIAATAAAESKQPEISHKTI